MKLVTLSAFPSGRTGVLVGDDVLDFALAARFVPLAGWVPQSMTALIAGGDDGFDLIRRIIDDISGRSADERSAMQKAGALQPFTGCNLQPPVKPGVLLSHGRAYHGHRKEMRNAYDATKEEPASAFLKNANSIVGSGAPIVLPPLAADMIDLEVEFSLVFGRTCHNVSERDALDYIAGYTLINDVSARNWVQNFRDTNNPDLNRMGKQFPSFTPLGPVIATKDEIADVGNVDLSSSINGNTMQSSNTSDLIYGIPHLIAYFSQWYEFRAGDVLTTGSPGGNGFGRKPPIFIKPGDVIAVSADSVGSLINPVIAG
jgi:2-keto-4-pentenoate hydratase/2-oxohepta-3-ene-1,7-dioic acid hydratase in catechol pathway